MKIRDGFVSNSSSSSFCVIGVSNSRIIDELFAAEKIKPLEGYDEDYYDFGYGCCSGKVVDFYGEGSEYVICAGIQAKKLLEKMPLPAARKEFCKIVKEKLDVDVNPRDVDLIAGEAGSG